MRLRNKRMTVVAILGFAILTIFAPIQSSGAAVRFNRQEVVGVNSYCGNHAYGALRTAQVQWARITLPWYDIQPSDPATAPPSYKGTALDQPFLKAFKQCVDQAIDNGMKVLVVFHSAPSWALSASGVPIASAYASALGSIASDKALPEVSAWEIWNEENMYKSWKGTPRQYVQLLRAAYTAVKKANPNALVVFGGTEHDGAGWLKHCYKAGARGYFDVFADHPYPPHKTDGLWAHSIGTVKKARAVMVAQGDSAKPIWLTEFGWSRSAENPKVSPKRQARLLTKTYSFLGLHEPYVTKAFWYQAQDTCSDSSKWGCGLGLLTYTGELTPAYWAMAAYNARHGGG